MEYRSERLAQPQHAATLNLPNKWHHHASNNLFAHQFPFAYLYGACLVTLTSLNGNPVTTMIEGVYQAMQCPVVHLRLRCNTTLAIGNYLWKNMFPPTLPVVVYYHCLSLLILLAASKPVQNCWCNCDPFCTQCPRAALCLAVFICSQWWVLLSAQTMV